MGGADDAAQAQEQDCSRYDERHTDKGFRKGDGKGDRKDPIGMGVRHRRDPGAGVVDKPMKEIKKHAFSAFSSRRAPRTDADIALLGLSR